MSEYIINDEQIAENRRLHGKKLLVMPVIVRCRDCLSWHKGYCYKHAYEVANEYGDTFTEGVFPMDDSGFCSLGKRREP